MLKPRRNHELSWILIGNESAFTKPLSDYRWVPVNFEATPYLSNTEKKPQCTKMVSTERRTTPGRFVPQKLASVACNHNAWFSLATVS